jgi:hypothetical protein
MKLIGRGLFPLLFLFFLFIQSCGKKEKPPKGVYYFTKGQAVQQIKLLYPDLSEFQVCSRPPDEICSWEDIFIFEDSQDKDLYDLVFRDGNGRIIKIDLEKEIFFSADYYYFTVTRTTGEVTKKGVFHRELIKTSPQPQFSCRGKTFWNIPVTSNCVVFQ